MAKTTTTINRRVSKVKRKLGKHSKKKHSNNKNSKNYKKPYQSQGR